MGVSGAAEDGLKRYMVRPDGKIRVMVRFITVISSRGRSRTATLGPDMHGDLVVESRDKLMVVHELL